MTPNFAMVSTKVDGSARRPVNDNKHSKKRKAMATYQKGDYVAKCELPNSRMNQTIVSVHRKADERV